MAYLLETENCEACGQECFAHELQSVRLRSFSKSFAICKSCLSKNASEVYKDTSSILEEISSILKKSGTSDKRLEEIKKIIEG